MQATSISIKSNSNSNRSKELVSKAVFGHKSSSSLKDRIFAFWFRRLVYTQIWEDPIVDLKALNVQANDHILTIGSGGCNALAYLLANPAQLSVVDLNHAHISLIKLKIAAIRSLNYKNFLEFFGVANATINTKIYDKIISPLLDDDSRNYWESGPIGFRRIQMFSKGFYKYGLLGQIIGIIHFAAKLHGVKLKDLLIQPTIQAQKDWFDENVSKIFDSKLVSKLCSSPFALYNLGIPPSQHQALCDEQPQTMAQVLKERARQLATVVPVNQNYFAWQAFGRCYDTKNQLALPPYLQEMNFELLKQSTHKLHIEQIDIRSAIAKMPNQSLDAVVLLDAQDWMSNDEINSLWTEISRAARPGTRVIFRTAGAKSPLEECFTNEMVKLWKRDDELSDSLGTQDRSGIYGAFHLYRFQT